MASEIPFYVQLSYHKFPNQTLNTFLYHSAFRDVVMMPISPDILIPFKFFCD